MRCPLPVDPDIAGWLLGPYAASPPAEEMPVEELVARTGGPDDVTTADDPLVTALLERGLARPHPLGLGFDTGEHGLVSPGLHGIGVLRRGELYETTSVPGIRDQAGDLARHLLQAWAARLRCGRVVTMTHVTRGGR